MPMRGSYVGHCYGKLNMNLMQLLQLSKDGVMQATQVSESPNMLLAITEVTIILENWNYCRKSFFNYGG